jgi:hypothetical protein
LDQRKGFIELRAMHCHPEPKARDLLLCFTAQQKADPSPDKAGIRDDRNLFCPQLKNMEAWPSGLRQQS